MNTSKIKQRWAEEIRKAENAWSQSGGRNERFVVWRKQSTQWTIKNVTFYFWP